MKDIQQLLKKCSSSFKNDFDKKNKPRKTGNSGKGGFIKETHMPKILRDYLGIKEDELLGRPAVAKLLHAKFKEEGFKNGENKKITIISSKTVAKQLGCEVGLSLDFGGFHKFIATFYNAEKQVLTV